MSIKNKRAGRTARNKATSAADTARPYIHRLIEDEELRENLRGAYDAGRSAYERAAGAKSATAAFEDKKLQKELRSATESLRAATEALREPEKGKARRGGGLGKLLLVAIIGAILALALSEGLRKAVLDQLFGAEEEFEYTPPAAAQSPEGA